MDSPMTALSDIETRDSLLNNHNQSVQETTTIITVDPSENRRRRIIRSRDQSRKTMQYKVQNSFSVLSIELKDGVKKTMERPQIRKTRYFLKRTWRWIMILVIPLILAIIFGRNFTKLSRGAFILFLMGGYWVTNCIPMYVTAMLPIILGPAFGIIKSRDICKVYMKDTVMLFIGGLIIAMGIEKSNLHRRISLTIIKHFGVGQRALLLGFMLPTWFLSMWINNTATTAMMMAIISSVLTNLEQIQSNNLDKILNEATSMSKNKEEEIARLKPLLEKEDDGLKNFGKAVTLAIAYASSCGGIATLTGTAPNSILKGIINGRFGSVETFSYASWIGYALPISLLLLLTTWIWLMIRFLGFNYQELVCLLLFLLTSILWISRKPGTPGWSSLFVSEVVNNKEVEYVGDAQPAIFVSILLMTLPATNPINGIRKLYRELRDPSLLLDDEAVDLDKIPENIAAEKRPDIFLLPWRTVQRKFPWGIVFILGGGFALSECCIKSELSNYIGEYLSKFTNVNVNLLVFLICMAGTIITEVTSNAATASILIPIALDMSTKSSLHPFILAFPLTISTSFSFCLPVSTPPNAIVFSTGRVSIKDMVTSGLVLNLLGAIILTGGTLTWGKKMFDMDTIPDWAK